MQNKKDVQTKERKTSFQTMPLQRELEWKFRLMQKFKKKEKKRNSDNIWSVFFFMNFSYVEAYRPAEEFLCLRGTPKRFIFDRHMHYFLRIR